MDILLALCAPIAITIWVVYTIINRFVTKIPDVIAWPVLIICAVLMIVGIAYNGWCFGKGINPYDVLKG